MELQGKVALVTGSGRGIGEAICRKLSEHGAAVAVADIDGESAARVADELKQGGVAAVGLRHDVVSWDSTAAAVADATAALGPIDILVNNAGVTKQVALVDMDEQEWDRTLDINLKGTYLTCRHVLPGMIARQSGRIINMSSILGKNGIAYSAHYCASKFAVIGLTQSIAREVGQFNITANTVCPGIVESPMVDEVRQEMASMSSEFGSPSDVARWMRGLSPLKRTQQPEDIAEMVAYLASDRAKNMTGGSYHVDGGIVA